MTRRSVTRILLSAVLVAASLFLGAGCSSQVMMKRHFSRAEKYFAKERYAEAFVEYINVLRKDPTNRVAISQAGLACFEMGDYRRSYPFLVKARELDPTNLVVRVKLGNLYLLSGQPEKAGQEAEAILATDPDFLDGLILLSDATNTSEGRSRVIKMFEARRDRFRSSARFQMGLGTAYLRARQFDAAEQAYREAQRIEPKSPMAHQALGLLYRGRGARAKAGEEYEKAAELSAPDSAARTQLAAFYAEEGRTNDAVRVLEEVLRKKPDHPAAQYMLAEVDLAQARYDQCLKRIETVLRSQPENLAAMTLRAKVLLVQGKMEQAIAEHDRLVQRFPKSPQIRYQRAAMLISQRQPAKAQSDLQEALRLDPSFAAAQFMLAELQIRSGEAARASEALEAFLERASDKRAEKGQAMLLLSAAYRAQHAPQKAEALYRKLIEEQPKSAQLQYLLGLVLMEEEKAGEAKQAFETSMDLSPTSMMPLTQLAVLHLRTGKADEALKAVQKQIAASPDSAPLHYLLGTVHLAMHGTNDAERAFLKAVELQPRYSGAYIALSRLYASTGKDREALKKIEASLQANPKDLAALMFAGTICQQLKEVDKAREYYEKALAIKPDFPAVANNLAALYSEDLKDLDKAYELAKRAHDSAPDDPYIADTLGWVLCLRGDFKPALPLIAESAEKLPENSEVLYHFGVANLMLGDEASASNALRRALTGTPVFPSAAHAGKLLDLLNTDPPTAELEPALARLTADQGQGPQALLALLKAGQLWTRKGDANLARQAYEKALKQNAQFVPARIELAELLAGTLKAPKEAVQEAEKAYDLAPSSPEAGAALGWSAFLNRDYPKAFTLLQEARQRRPDRALFVYRSAWASYMMGRVEEARDLMPQALTGGRLTAEEKASAEQFLSFSAPPPSAPSADAIAKALDRDPSYLPALVARAQGEEKLRVADAIKSYEGITEQYPQFMPAFKDLLRLYASTENGSDKAVSVGRRTREVATADVAVAKALGIVAYCHKDYKWAAELLSESARRLPDDADVAFYRGLCAKALKDVPAARQHLQRALDLKPAAPWAKRAREALSAL